MSKRILVIDDEELVTRSLLKLLTAAGYSVSVVASGLEALRKLKKSEFDLIISDVRMPDLDGIETIKRIRAALKEAGKKPVPEILITGYADKDKYDTAMELGIVDYLYKPFDREELLEVIRQALE